MNQKNDYEQFQRRRAGSAGTGRDKKSGHNDSNKAQSGSHVSMEKLGTKIPEGALSDTGEGILREGTTEKPVLRKNSSVKAGTEAEARE